LRVIVSGHVQGVGYRMWAVAEANRRRLAGWVRNCRDGTVEVLLRGDEAAMEDMITALWQGPPAAEVTHVESMPTTQPVPAGFRVLPNA
jgi:acylphosphatase